VLLKTNKGRFSCKTYIEFVRDARIDDIDNLSGGDGVETRSRKRGFILDAKDACASAARALKVEGADLKTDLGPGLVVDEIRDAMCA
jgi:hypothetical protein